MAGENTEHELIATIKGVDISEGKKKDGSNWKRAAIKLDNGSGAITVGTFDTNDIDTANKLNGGEVKIKYTTDGQYRNLVKGEIRVASPEEKVENNQSVPQEKRVAVQGNYWENKELRDIKKDRQISRHGAYNTAVELYKLVDITFTTIEEAHNAVTKQADKVLEYVNKEV